MKQAAPRSGEWVIVCDGRKALILENAGDDNSSTAEQGGSRARDLSTRARAPIRPGARTRPWARPAARGQVDWHDASERAFLEKLAQRLDAASAAERRAAFIVIAAPRALGMLRPAYTPAVRRAVRAEIGKDYVRHRPERGRRTAQPRAKSTRRPRDERTDGRGTSGEGDHRRTAKRHNAMTAITISTRRYARPRTGSNELMRRLAGTIESGATPL